VGSEGDRQAGAAAVEYVALVLLVAVAMTSVLAVLASRPPRDAARQLGATLARRLRCAPALPGPCWRDRLTLAYGRSLAGAVRALAPKPSTVEGLAPVDFRYCRHATCAVPSSRPGLTTSNRRITEFTSVADRRRATGQVEITYWLYRPGLGWSRVTRTATSAQVAALASTPLLDDAVPTVVPLETLPGRDSYTFPAREEPPWRGRVATRFTGYPG
jgi:hypothetical protein